MILIEIIVILIILFIINPERSMDILRKAGFYTGRFRKYLREIKQYSNEFNLNNMEKEAKEDNNEGRKNRSSESHVHRNSTNKNNPNFNTGEDIKIIELAFLDIIESNYTYNMSKSIIPFLFDDSRRVVDKTISILKKDPLFTFEKRSILRKRDGVIKMNPDSTYFNEIFSPQRINEITSCFIEIPEHRFKRFLKVFAEFRGIDNLRLDEIFSKDKLHLYGEYKKYRKEFIQRWYHPQGFVSPSYACNLDCKYCFSKDLYKKFSNDMKLEDFKIYLKRLKNELHAEEIGLFGGEPTYFKKLPEFIKELEKEELYFNIATNGISEKEQWQFLASHGALRMITLHIESDDFYKSTSEIDTIIENIRYAGTQHKPITFRFNITKVNGNDWSFLDKYIDLVPEFIFSFALPFPAGENNNEYVLPDEITNYGKVIINMIHHIRDYCSLKKFRIALAKPIPLCVFTTEEYKEILKYVWYKNICEVDRNNNTNNIIINPNGTFQPCAGLNSEKYIFKDFGSGKPFPSSYHMNISRLTNKPLLPQCKSCYLFSIGVCQGLCYAYSK